MFDSFAPTNTFFALAATCIVLAFYFWQKNKKSSGTSNTWGKKSNTPILNSFTVDFTQREQEGELDPVIGRQKEIDRVTQILARRTKNNPILLGPPGVGKTAIVEGLALKIITGDVPEVLQNKRVLSLQVAEILAGTKYRGEFEERARKLVNEIAQSNRDIILFVDEIHTLIEQKGTEGSINFTDILKPSLARGQLQLIGATTLKEYDEFIKPDASLERRFQVVDIKEPNKADTLAILKGVQKNYEEYHNVLFTDAALKAAVDLSEKYIKGRVLPDKAIDVIDEAAAKVKVEQGSTKHALDLLNKAATQVKHDHKHLPTRIEKLQTKLEELKKKEKATQGNAALKNIRKHIVETVKAIEHCESRLSMLRGRPIVDVIHIKEVVRAWTGKKI
ncbi:MAG: ATPase AAA-2 domain protein [Candidatus Magasanikbacteria bacterium GW2011_GWA2_46_17]|uniref:ATPase AAA-2 domain protein n=1 Tax=Candidatus Magasanikbacteria bacterium GW2011_GWA2_46_17 TaxID=1619042 RepID=A0A0G1S224_9BACT|nr:MAG: ATPase AAA-2 domain protein [Candidatus Magasanikbacteria bacterium GW2011_GWA2_46_17]HBF67175.1 hypothetical protein [Candidatus Magasanikbacteria bacterium]